MKKELIEDFYKDYDRLDKTIEEKEIIADIHMLEHKLYQTMTDEQIVIFDTLMQEKLELEKLKATMFARALVNYVIEKE